MKIVRENLARGGHEKNREQSHAVGACHRTATGRSSLCEVRQRVEFSAEDDNVALTLRER